MRVVRVPLGERSYSIVIGRNLWGRLGQELRKMKLARRCAVITDRNVAPLFGKMAQEALSSARFDPVLITVPAGETAKSLEIVSKGYDQLAAHQLERKSFVVAVGGGVVGDLAGFIAATYLRGIGLIQMPTTLLAQVDSSVGGKVGVNLKAGKNLVGAFYQPRLVLCDLETLETLPVRELRAGLAEVIKYGIIYDASLFRKLEKSLDNLLARDMEIMNSVIAWCCAIKAEIVAKDEKESGLRAILNFGHTIGHALEALGRYGTLLHGEAIAIGQAAAAKISAELCGLPAEEATRIRNILRRAGLPTELRLRRGQFERLLATMSLDKKVSGGEIQFVLADRIGRATPGHRVPVSLIEKALRAEYCDWQASHQRLRGRRDNDLSGRP